MRGFLLQNFRLPSAGPHYRSKFWKARPRKKVARSCLTVNAQFPTISSINTQYVTTQSQNFLTFYLIFRKSLPVRVCYGYTVTILGATTVLTGRRLSEAGKLHLINTKHLRDSTWYTICGRKLRRDYVLPNENFDFGQECCSCCSYKHKHPVAA
jgi:hypothetical protein